MTKVGVVYHSSSGRTKVIAEHVAIGAEQMGCEAKLFDCAIEVDLEYLNACDAIIFGCPTYMGSVSGQMKLFMDGTSEVYRYQKWRNKIAAGFTTSSALSGDKLNTLMQIALFAFQQGMVWVGLDLPAGVSASTHTGDRMNRIGSWIGLMSQVNGDQSLELSPDKSDRDTAEYLGKRVAEFAKKLEK
ncbi:MAG: NADPH-dependent reductase [Candidatus Midichloriaceae bacterium]|jgi:multimeric flavodoxin WrbA|nr:NADPH-dependent reductase [Candidatus Midichloriaceae bacterium]